jgi:lysine 2-monooxygenase
MERLDLAIIGGGIAGASVAEAMTGARPDWSIGLFERTDRIGGRLRSQRMAGAAHPIELGGMRYLTSQPLMSSVIERFRIATHSFDETGGGERTLLRGVVGGGADDPAAGAACDLAPDERGRSASELAMRAFEIALPGFRGLDHDGFVARRASARYLDRAVTDWAIGDVFASVLCAEGHRFVVDAFGYDSGVRAFNAPDFLEFLFSGGNPTEEARTPDDGMDAIPTTLASAFEAAGGHVRLGHELAAIEVDDEGVVLRFEGGLRVRAEHVVLALAVPALRLLARTSPTLAAPAFEGVLDSVEPFPAMKLYLSYDGPWWRPTVPGIRTVTDLPNRKLFYFDGSGGERSVLLAMYTDGLDVRLWAEVHDGVAPGAAASAPMLAAVQDAIRGVHPQIADIPAPLESAVMYWGADPHETGWHFWRAGYNSDEILEVAPQPDPQLPIHLAGEAFSRRQSWAEGALESAAAVVHRLGERGGR